MSWLERTLSVLFMTILFGCNLVVLNRMKHELETEIMILEDIRHQEATLTRLVIYIMQMEKK